MPAGARALLRLPMTCAAHDWALYMSTCQAVNRSAVRIRRLTTFICGISSITNNVIMNSVMSVISTISVISTTNGRIISAGSRSKRCS